MAAKDLETRIERLEAMVRMLEPPSAPLHKVYDEAGEIEAIWSGDGRLLFKRPDDTDAGAWKGRLLRALKAWQEYHRRPRAVPRPDKAKAEVVERELQAAADDCGLTLEEYAASLRLEAIERFCGLT